MLGQDEVLHELVRNGNLIPILAIVLGIGVGMLGIICGSIVSIVRVKAFEATRREVAAYVAEGSMTPQDAVALLNSGKAKWEVASAEDVFGSAVKT